MSLLILMMTLITILIYIIFVLPGEFGSAECPVIRLATGKATQHAPNPEPGSNVRQGSYGSAIIV
jgi:hypothetical protein